MTAAHFIPIGLAAGLIATAASGAPKMQPPMNNFDFAFYTCEGGAFQITYDSDTPTSATMTTSDNNKQYVLARKPTDDGVQFASGAARFWTDGRKVVVEGTRAHLENCKRKSN